MHIQLSCILIVIVPGLPYSGDGGTSASLAPAPSPTLITFSGMAYGPISFTIKY